MKVFEFDPKTGKRGQQIGEYLRVTYTGPYYQNYSGVVPLGSENQEITVHVDAGIMDRVDGKFQEVSYRHPTKWVTFCLGEMFVGQGKGIWQWIIVPPKSIEV